MQGWRRTMEDGEEGAHVWQSLKHFLDPVPAALPCLLQGFQPCWNVSMLCGQAFECSNVALSNLSLKSK